jgi:hypothetical protein
VTDSESVAAAESGVDSVYGVDFGLRASARAMIWLRIDPWVVSLSPPPWLLSEIGRCWGAGHAFAYPERTREQADYFGATLDQTMTVRGEGAGITA